MSEMKNKIKAEPHVEHMSNRYPIVKSETCYVWDCPECHTVNHIIGFTHLHQRGVDECRKCERAVNVMEPHK